MTADSGLAAVSPGQRAALAQWLTHIRALNGAAAHTVTAYAADVARYLDFLARHRGAAEGTVALLSIPQSDLRAWMAHERARGLGPRSLARALSAVKGFTGWLAERDGVDATAILSARGPKYRRSLPRPLSEDGARDMIDRVETQAREDWIAARDAAVVTLLYGCGLRISEALGLTGAASPLPEVLRITGKGGKTRLVPVIPAPGDIWATSRLVGLVEQATGMNAGLQVRVVPNMVQGTALALAAMQALKEIPLPAARSFLTLRTAYRQAQAEGSTVLTLRDIRAREEATALVDEVSKLLGLPKKPAKPSLRRVSN